MGIAKTARFWQSGFAECSKLVPKFSTTKHSLGLFQLVDASSYFSFMVHMQISFPEKLDELVVSLAHDQGKKKDEVIVEAVAAYVRSPTTRDEILAGRRAAFGMWKDRTDLLNF